MTTPDAIRGDLQKEIMRILWAAGSASVEEVRAAIPEERRGAYTTVQTVLNRLSDRGLIERQKKGRAMQYAVKITEADYVASSLQRTLTQASEPARRAALTNLVEELGTRDLEAISEMAAETQRRRAS